MLAGSSDLAVDGLDQESDDKKKMEGQYNFEAQKGDVWICNFVLSSLQR